MSKPNLVEYQRMQRERQKEQFRIKRLIVISIKEEHNKRTCDCEGCKWWWFSNVETYHGQFFEILPNIKTMIRQKGIDLYTTGLMLRLRRLVLVGGESLWIAWGSNKGWVRREL